MWAGAAFNETEEKVEIVFRNRETLNDEQKEKSLNSFKVPIGYKVVKNKGGTTRVTLKTFNFGSIKLISKLEDNPDYFLP